MAFDEEMAARVRQLLDARFDVEDKRMFSGVAFMVSGNMACAVISGGLMVRVGPDQAPALLEAEQAVRPMEMRGRPMRGWVVVAPEALADDADLERWVRRGEEFASSLPPK